MGNIKVEGQHHRWKHNRNSGQMRQNSGVQKWCLLFSKGNNFRYSLKQALVPFKIETRGG